MSASLTENTAILSKYLDLPQNGKVLAEYVWIDAEGRTRSKCKTLNKKPSSVDDLPEWNYDGSSTGQAQVMIRIFTCVQLLTIQIHLEKVTILLF